MVDYTDIKAEPLRRLVALLAVAVTAYYLWWRVTATLNPNALLFAWLLWSAELFGAIKTALLYFVVWRPITRPAPPPLPGKTVDVLVPTMNEEASVLRTTLLACNDMTYPHRTIVLDDGGREAIRRLCEELGVDYLARDRHEGAKAGNLNFGLSRSTAEFVAVFDADHAPLPHFLDRLMGFFEDEKLAFVQSPQDYYNIDSFQHRVDRGRRHIWAEQSLFYSLIEPGRDRWNAAYFVGSCAVLRRKALDDVDGFQTGSITEDMLTSIRIHSKGWRSAYHTEKLAYGIAAETIRPFLLQRSRWGLGGWQVFFKANPLFLPGLSLAQRLCYFESLIYTLEGFQKLVFYLTPPIALVTGVLPMRALDIAYLVHFIPYYALSLIAFNEMCRGYGGILMLEQYSMGKFVAYMKTLGMMLFPRRARFHVTPKGRHAPMTWRLVAAQTIVGAVSVAAIAYALAGLLLRWRNDEFIVAVNSLWALYNSGLALGIILFARRKFVQRRELFRIDDAVPVVCRFDDGGREVRRLGVADDLTRRGAGVIVTGNRPPSGEMSLEFVMPSRTIESKGRIVHRRSVEVNGYDATRAGIVFTEIGGDERDEMTRYLHESSVDKFMADFDDRYRTWLERRLDGERKRMRRARRHEGLVPIVVRNGHETMSYGVIRNISSTGVLVSTWDELPPGHEVNLYAGIGDELIPIPGTVIRMRRHRVNGYHEYRSGISFARPGSFKVRYTAWYVRKSGELR